MARSPSACTWRRPRVSTSSVASWDWRSLTPWRCRLTRSKDHHPLQKQTNQFSPAAGRVVCCLDYRRRRTHCRTHCGVLARTRSEIPRELGTCNDSLLANVGSEGRCCVLALLRVGRVDFKEKVKVIVVSPASRCVDPYSCFACGHRHTREGRRQWVKGYPQRERVQDSEEVRS